ncbi:MAG: hypothetical protein LBD94_01730 [Rickettsiales bacterium]|jgi:hypothetical protein|nr:hypothetical protein [Rickettsiales bacterium]
MQIESYDDLEDLFNNIKSSGRYRKVAVVDFQTGELVFWGRTKKDAGMVLKDAHRDYPSHKSFLLYWGGVNFKNKQYSR